MKVNVYIDESGSMTGGRLAIAHCLALGITGVGYTTGLYGFSGPNEFVGYQDHSGMLSHFFCGGTNFAQILEHSLQEAEHGAVTAVIITDGYCGVDPVLANLVRGESQLRIVVVLLDSTIDVPGGIGDVADKVLIVEGRYNPDVQAIVQATVTDVWAEPEPDEAAPEAPVDLSQHIATVVSAFENAIETFLDSLRTPPSR